MVVDVSFDSLLGCKAAKWSLEFGKCTFLERSPARTSWCCWRLREQSLDLLWNHLTELRATCQFFLRLLWKYVICRLKGGGISYGERLEKEWWWDIRAQWFVSQLLLKFALDLSGNSQFWTCHCFSVVMNLGSNLCWCTIFASWEHTEIVTNEELGCLFFWRESSEKCPALQSLQESCW